MGIANTLALVRATLDKLRWTVPGVAKIAVTAPSRRPRGDDDNSGVISILKNKGPQCPYTTAV